MFKLMQIVNNDEQYNLDKYENIADIIRAASHKFKDVSKFMISDHKEQYIYGIRVFPTEIIWRMRRPNKRGRDFRFWDRWVK